MDVRFEVAKPAEWAADAVIMFSVQGEDQPAGFGQWLASDGKWLKESPAWADFEAKKGQVGVFYPASGPRVIVAGLGEIEKVDFDRLRLGAAAAMQKARDLGCATVGLPLQGMGGLSFVEIDEGEDVDEDMEQDMIAITLEEVLCGALLGLYRFDRFLTAEPDGKEVGDVVIFAGSQPTPALEVAAEAGRASAMGVYLTRDLGNIPGNVATPDYMARTALWLGERHGFNVEVFDIDEIEEMGMGAFAAVAKGSHNRAKLVVMEHCPEGCEDQKPLVLVGKGVTFDTGGISIKPSAKMHEMKDDMCGAGAVLGFFETVGQLGLQRRVAAVLPFTDNMPDGRATRPGDIVTTYSGKTVEIINTDAEGRLLLIDALAYAQERFDPDMLVDLATLTGAAVVALGQEIAAAFGHPEHSAFKICDAGDRVGEKFWPMPLWENYAELLKSDCADLQNTGPREGGTINAAVFIKQFVNDDVEWVHLDIAPTATTGKTTPLCPKGATGFGVRTLVELAAAGVMWDV